MGADLCLTYLPACQMTPARQRHLRGLIEDLDHEELQDAWDYSTGEPATKEEFPVVREALNAAMAVLVSARERRDVVYWSSSDLAQPLLVTGGITWGDAPTEAFSAFELLGAVDRIYNQLKSWGQQDLAEKPHESS